jgi:phosphoribosylglycinamide formyltransferase 1
LEKVFNITVFASGKGSNTDAIIRNTEQGLLKSRISLIISDREHAGIFNIARQKGIRHLHLDPSSFTSEEKYCTHLAGILNEAETDLILLAGYLKKIPAEIIRLYRHRMMNIHPALLPAFGGKGMYGIHVHRAAIEYGVKISGVTVHFVDEEYDHGPVILQEPVPVLDSDTPESLAERILKVEHTIYSHAVKLFEEGRIKVRERKVFVTESSIPGKDTV